MGKIEKIRFTSNGATTESYSRFMLHLLNVLTKDADRRGSIPILPQLSQTNSNSYVHVEISNGRSQTVTFALYITNAYVVGYQNNANSIAYFFNSNKLDNKVQKAAFPNALHRERLHFDGDYDGFRKRSSVPLGFSELTNAISSLYKYRSGSDDGPISIAFPVVIQMISEAVRLKNLRQLILNTISSGRSYTSDGLMQAYENKWKKISYAVQNAIPNGNFQTPIILTYDSQQLVLRTVSQVIPIVSILLRDCNSLG